MKLLAILLLVCATSCGPRLLTNPLFTSPSAATPSGVSLHPSPHSAHPAVAPSGYSAWQVWLFIAGGIGVVCVASSYNSIFSFVKSRRRSGNKKPANVSLGDMQG